MNDEAPSQPGRRVVSAAGSQWAELGPFGRAAFAGVALALVITVVLGVWIPNLVRRHILEARAELIASIGNEIADRGLVPVGPPGSDSYQRLREEVELSLLGGETVRVKLWTVDGTVTYSDDTRLVGRTFEVTPTARRALQGSPAYGVSDLSEPAHAYERPLGQLLEFFVPVRDPNGVVVGLFEVEQTVDSLDATLSKVRRNVWLAIGIGIGLLGIFMATLTVASGRALNRRRRQAERLLGALVNAQEEERRRIVGALHDDIGQPLFRLLYGLEGARSTMAEGDPVRAEMERLVDLTRDVDRTLRGELSLLHQGIEEELGLEPGLREVVATQRAESGLDIDLRTRGLDHATVSGPAKVALLHAAREAIVNVRKHAEASHVAVTVAAVNGHVRLRVEDDGVGVRSEAGLGLVTTRERIEALGGSLRVSGSKGRGTIFQATIPTAGTE